MARAVLPGTWLLWTWPWRAAAQAPHRTSQRDLVFHMRVTIQRTPCAELLARLSFIPGGDELCVVPVFRDEDRTGAAPSRWIG
jgi:hypothetical protein